MLPRLCWSSVGHSGFHVGVQLTQPTYKTLMTHTSDTDLLNHVLQLVSDSGSDGLLECFRLLLNEAMRHERSETLSAQPYQRTDARQGYSNGFKPKTLLTRMGPVELEIPQVRNGVPFYPSALDKGLRSEQALKLALAEMYVQGVSTRKVSAIVEELCGCSVSSTHVSDCAKKLDSQILLWRNRQLGSTPYLILDARYEKVRRDGQVLDCAVLVALGIDNKGKRSIVGVSAALSEAEVHWREFLKDLQKRGLHGVKFIVSDDHAGLKAARRAVFTSVPWQRCQFHLQQNAQAYVKSLDQRKPVASAVRAIFNCADLDASKTLLKQTVDKYLKTNSKLAEWMEASIPEGLSVFSMPEPHRCRLRTSNALERVNEEIRRRTRVANIFPNEQSLLRLVGAMLMEKSEDWETGKTYLNMKAQDLTQE
jgi:putative transposase